MALDDTAEISRLSIVKQLILDWKAYRSKHSIDECTDDRLMAGCFLSWANGDIERAYEAVATHCSGKYLDRPPFAGCHETLTYLENLKIIVKCRQPAS